MTEFQSIIERLKTASFPFSVHLSRSPISADFFLTTNYSENIEHALYKRQDNSFVIVDFFSNPSEANKEATEIINTYPRLAATVGFQFKYHKQDISEAK